MWQTVHPAGSTADPHEDPSETHAAGTAATTAVDGWSALSASEPGSATIFGHSSCCCSCRHNRTDDGIGTVADAAATATAAVSAGFADAGLRQSFGLSVLGFKIKGIYFILSNKESMIVAINEFLHAKKSLQKVIHLTGILGFPRGRRHRSGR